MERKSIDNDEDDFGLLPVSSFLMATKALILTPRRGRAPVDDNLSPLKKMKPVKARNVNTHVKKLLQDANEADKVDRADQEIKVFASEFKDKNLMSSVSDREEHDLSSSLSQSQDQISGLDTYLCFNGTEKACLGNIMSGLNHDFSECFPGERIFVHGASQTTKADIKILIRYVYSEEQSMPFGEASYPVFLLGVLIRLISAGSCPPEIVLRCLWRIVALSDNCMVVSKASMLLSNLFKASVELTWVPGPVDFIDSLCALGGELSLLLPGDIPETIRKPLLAKPAESSKSLDLSGQECGSVSSKILNFRCLLRLFSVVLQKHSLKCRRDEFNCLLLLGFRLTVEPLLQSAVSDISAFLGTLLDAYRDADWKAELASIVRMVCSSCLHHRNMLHVVWCCPVNYRGAQLQQLLAFNVACRLIEGTVDVPLMLTGPIKVHSVLDLLSKVKITMETTDFHELYTVMSLLSICFSAVGSKEKKSLDLLIQKLTTMNSQIKDGRGVFLDRTKVKDVMIRLVSKLVFTSRGFQSQRLLDGYFDTTAGRAIEIEHLQTRTPDDQLQSADRCSSRGDAES